MLTVEEIKRNYQKFEDWKIKEIALNPKGLRKEIIPILNNEIKLRNLGIELINWVNSETNTIEGQERKNLIYKILKSNCSICKENSNLRGFSFHTIIAAGIILKDNTEKLIICSKCAKRKRLNALFQTLFFGWWSESGLLKTPYTLISELCKIFRKESENEMVINEFIDNNTRILRNSLEKNNLNQILKNYNTAK
jgi:hypothetical protein